MTKPREQPSRSQRQRDQEKKHRKHVLSPCDRPPISPLNPRGDFDRNGAARYHRLRLKGRWDEVHTDTSGFRVEIRHYQVQLEYSAQDTPGTWFEAERFMVPAKDDNEPNDTAHFIEKGSIVANLAYRWRVRAIARGGCKSDWSDWVDMGDAGGENPPAPTNVKIYDGAIDRVVVDWDPTVDGDDDEVLDEKVAHYGCMISQHQDFRDYYKRDIFVHGTQRTFKVAEADLGTQFFGRAWAVGVDRDPGPGGASKSAKVPAKLNGNSDPFVTADGVTVDSPQFAKIPSGVIHKWPGPLGKIPAGWLNCNGDSYSTTVYAELFAAIGYRYGGSLGQFNVPDLRGRFWKGAKSTEIEGDADDGFGYAMAEVDREDKHGKHPRHKHKHHHRNRRRDHDEVTAKNTGDGGGGHNHAVGPFNAPIGGPSATNPNIQGGGGVSVAGPAHTHDISGSTGQGGSAHQHPGLGGQATQGEKAKQQYPNYGPGPLPGQGSPAHADHVDQGVFSDGTPDVYADSITGGSRVWDGGAWDGGETDSGGSFTTVDEDVVVTAQNKGHRHHPKMKGHHIIKT